MQRIEEGDALKLPYKTACELLSISRANKRALKSAVNSSEWFFCKEAFEDQKHLLPPGWEIWPYNVRVDRREMCVHHKLVGTVVFITYHPENWWKKRLDSGKNMWRHEATQTPNGAAHFHSGTHMSDVADLTDFCTRFDYDQFARAVEKLKEA